MSSPTPEFEKRILRDVVEQLRDPQETLRKQTLTLRAIYGIGYAGLVVSFLLAMNGVSHPFLSAFLAAGSGCAIGFALYLSFAHRQWPIARDHLSIESVKKRLKELDGAQADQPNR